MVRVLFVCLGNICRSPTAHGVFQRLINESGLGDQVQVDSAGTAAWHEGKAPDSRSTKHAKARGYDLSALRARQAVTEDFERFDYILAMDEENLSNLSNIAPEHFQGKLMLLLDFIALAQGQSVPDPYYDSESGFENVLDLVESSCIKLLEQVKADLNSPKTVKD